ncbi:hypothetical protein [Hansschlegelia zhihuaiae]|uniref:DUF1833 domain-containing protein n=1 Tax=Hansschlegelia zhihuaiae TaxID=405005 RepID=A0A4Q0MFP4_9HYPH|nr:hypothetical protein [Hansschlegelia zhihuaiae]RXF72125.1 hypothetical protein EK403_15055 [Hansschlegelia zhihuaiae]
MPKKLPLYAAREMTSQHSAAVKVGLLTITPVVGDPILLCTDAAVRLSVDPLRYGLVSRGQTYDYLPMRVSLPGVNMNALPAAAIETDNVDPAVVAAVRSSINRAALDLETIFTTRPDEVVESWPGLEVVEATWDDDVASLKIGYPTLENIPLVRHRLTVNVSPALRNMG